MADEQVKFELAALYFKENKQAVEYDVNVSLVAHYKQATLGKQTPQNCKDVGWFDFVGQDRKAAWDELGDMSKEAARAKFVEILSANSKKFEEWLAERIREKEELERQERERQEHERLRREEEERIRLEEERLRREAEEQERIRAEQERLHQLHLQAQREQQERALRLQQQQIQQQQQQQQAAQMAQQAAGAAGAAGASGGDGIPAHAPMPVDARVPRAQLAAPEYIEAFRKALADRPESEVVVKSGEVLTVRVPKPTTVRTQIMWQFNTLHYDLSFGVDFERVNEDGSLTIEPILPVIRTASQAEVVTGSHATELKGTWLLKFDNSYSYFRTKTLFYRIMCTNL